jgi:cytoplasmic iron level regulating protein YaaA (DUF328/UPF0246 family)
LELEVITPQFFELTPNGPKQISFYAKKARGAMARFVVENRIDKTDDLIEFNLAGYSFQKDGSTRVSPVFRKKNQLVFLGVTSILKMLIRRSISL